METCGEGCFVKAQGQISKYQNRFQITLTRMRLAANSEVDTADFVPATSTTWARCGRNFGDMSRRSRTRT